MLFPNQRVMLLIPPIPMQARTLVIIYGAIELLLGFTGLQPGVAHFAHLGELLFGWLLINYWRGTPPLSRRGSRVRRFSACQRLGRIGQQPTTIGRASLWERASQ